MNDSNRFYLERDKRVSLYLGGKSVNQQPIHIVADVGTMISPTGQACLLALTNLAARVHRNICFVLPSVSIPLAVPCIVPAGDLTDAVLSLARSIDPYGHFRATDKRPAETAISVGLGNSLPPDLTWYIGARGAIASLSSSCAPEFAWPSASLMGAALASCLGATALFRTALEMQTVPRTLSCWNYKEGDAAAVGPKIFPALSVGRTLVVGTGAVGSALTYWLHLFGVGGEWDLVDPDPVELHNTSRQMLFTAKQAGWPNGVADLKCEIAAKLLPNSGPHSKWYDACDALKEVKYDVILALANERNVRTQLAARNAAVVLHATTGRNWLSQLHRHILGADDCIRCRMNDIQAPRLGCSTATISTEDDNGETATDASLPFLSAASGLMLATALQKLQSGELHNFPENDWRWDFGSPHRMASSGKRSCNAECSIVPEASLRRALNKGTRWGPLVK